MDGIKWENPLTERVGMMVCRHGENKAILESVEKFRKQV
jgi:hypothetical protein